MPITGIISGQFETSLATSFEGTALGSGPISSDSQLLLLYFLCCRQLTYLRRSATMWPNHSCWPWWIRWWADGRPRNWCLVQTKSHPELPVIYRWILPWDCFVRIRVLALVAVHHVSHFPAGSCSCRAEISVHRTTDILHIVKYLCSHVIKRDVAVWAVICLMSLQSVWQMLLTLIFIKIW